MKDPIAVRRLFAMIVALAMTGASEGATVDISTLGSPAMGTGGAQINLSGFNSLFGDLSYNSVAVVVQVGTAGVLSQVDLQLAGTGPASLTLYLLPVIGSAPATDLGDAFGSWNVASPQWSSPGLYPVTSVDLSSANRQFSVGDWVALALVSNTPDVVTGWRQGGSFSPRVTSFDRSNPTDTWDTSVLGSGGADLALRTYMSPVPLPAAAWPLLSGLGGLAALGGRRRRA